MSNETAITTTVVEEETQIDEYTPELSVERVIEQTEKVHELVKKVMKQDEHFGPAFKDGDKNVLYKQGAEKFNLLFQVRAEYAIDEKMLPTGHREYKTVCTLLSRGNERVVATGVGLCTTMEKKYRWRNANLICPECDSESVFKSKKEPGWYCWAKKGGCGMQFAPDDDRIASQTQGKKENEDIADVYNTVLKISKKRAYVDATITLGALSDLFTQDIEDFRDEPKQESSSAALLELSSDDREAINMSVKQCMLLTDNPEVPEQMQQYLSTVPALILDTYSSGKNPAKFLRAVLKKASAALSQKKPQAPAAPAEPDIQPPEDIDATIAEEVKKVHKNTIAGIRLCTQSGYLLEEPAQGMEIQADNLLETGNEAGLKKLYDEVRKIFDDAAKSAAPPPEEKPAPEQKELV